MDEKDLPPYSGPGVAESNDSKKKVKKEITLLHSPLVGVTGGREETILLPPDTTLIRTWSGWGVDGIEYFSSTGATQLLGTRSGSPQDFRVPLNNYISAVQVRSGQWIDAIQYSLSTGTVSNWFGGDGGSVSHVNGNIVGFVGIVQEGGGVLGQFGVITCPDLNAYETFHRETQEAGRVRADTNVVQREPSRGEHEGASGTRDKAKYRWDTGRLTGGRGIGVRWNHERNRVEIYQG